MRATAGREMSGGVDPAEIEGYFDRLWPICRSITGDGVRATLQILREIIPLEIHEVPTGTRAFDWQVPREWNIRDAYIVAPGGEKIVDFHSNNLHVVNYSTPVDRELGFDELDPHLHYSEELPDAIPYKTSYYQEDWGFCLSHQQYRSLPKTGTYRAYIDASLKDGSMTYGDLLLEGDSSDEVLLTTYICHPSMANNELSGPLVTAFLYRMISQLPRRKYSYRFVYAPETIGAICYLSRNGNVLKERLKAGYVISCIGDAGPYSYKRSRRGDSLADEAATAVLCGKGVPQSRIRGFSPVGNDQRQYCSPGFDLPVGSIARAMDGSYREYHTSLDNKGFISFDALRDSIETCYEIVSLLERDGYYKNTVMYCEPQLGRRGLYPSMGGKRQKGKALTAMLWVLNMSDGTCSLLDILRASGIDYATVSHAVETLKRSGLIERVDPPR